MHQACKPQTCKSPRLATCNGLARVIVSSSERTSAERVHLPCIPRSRNDDSSFRAQGPPANRAKMWLEKESPRLTTRPPPTVAPGKSIVPLYKAYQATAKREQRPCSCPPRIALKLNGQRRRGSTKTKAFSGLHSGAVING